MEVGEKGEEGRMEGGRKGKENWNIGKKEGRKTRRLIDDCFALQNASQQKRTEGAKEKKVKCSF